MPGEAAAEKAVFLNVPYDREFFPLFTALIAGLVALGRIPPCAMEEYRLDASLSDMKAFDPFSHGGTPKGILSNLLKCFGTPGETPRLRTLMSLNTRLSRVASRAQLDFSSDDLFNRPIFLRLVEAATTEAVKRGLIAA